MLQQDRIDYCFSLKYELPDVEFKGPGKGRENPLFGKVVRAAMAMANRRGGGIVIIGVTETAAGLSFDGLTAEQLATWKHEYVADGFNSYTSSHIEFDIIEHEHDSHMFIILDVHEFAIVPIMCTKSYRDNTDKQKPERDRKVVLYENSFYVRTINKPESRQMQTSEEVRLLIETVIDKGVQSFVTLTKLAGIQIAPAPGDKELFDAQLQNWTGSILEEIRSRGYWDIRIRPVTFQPERLRLSELYPLLVRSLLNSGPVEFPYTTLGRPETGATSISLEYQKEFYLQS
jgi:hypothetical protein